MNDTIREKLSAYLDGALPDADRRAVEVEISHSEELRLELESLRAVSAAVKSLPKEKLPSGFMARLEDRRSREASKPTRNHFILTPAYRPLAFALSTAVVALVVWDKTQTPSDIVVPRVGWDSEKVAVKSAAEAPPSIDVSGRLSAMGERNKNAKDESTGNAAAAYELTAQSVKKEDAAANLGTSSTYGKRISAPGKPLELQEADGIASVTGAGGTNLASPSSPATAPAPTHDQFKAAEGKSGAFLAHNEEERSAINERLYKDFEEEKKRMGIARIMDKDAESQDIPAGGQELMTLQATPGAARVDNVVAAMRGVARAKRRSAPLVKALTLKSAEALSAAWAAASLPGKPPAVNFPDEMAVFLSGPQGCGIVTVQNRKKFIVVLYKNAGFDDASARVRAVTLSPKPIVIKPAE